MEDRRSGGDGPPGLERQEASLGSSSRPLVQRFLRIKEPKQRKALLASLIGGALAIFAFDLATPNELAPEMLHAAVILGSLWMREPRRTAVLAALSTLLIILGDPSPAWVALLNHGLSILLVWVIALLVVGVHGFLTEIQEQAAILEGDIRRRQELEDALRQTQDGLERRVQERTVDLSRAVQALAGQSEQLRALTTELALAEQRERRRLAEVLHDGLQQLLVAATIRLDQLRRTKGLDVAEACGELSHLLHEAIACSRSLTGELSPPILHAGGFRAGLEWLVRWMAEKHHLRVDLTVDRRAVPDSEAMTVLLFQSVRELLFNVVKHAQAQSARVEVGQQDGRIRIEVSDQGVGFDQGRVPPMASGGLGLTSIWQRLQFLGGWMEVVSAPGQGSRFTLIAPLMTPPAVHPVSPPPGPSPQAGGVGMVRRSADGRTQIRVVVVDDHTLVRHAFIQMLRHEPGFAVVGEAGDGKVAIDLVRELKPDVVLMDINMPVLDGLQATRAIRTDCPGVQVIGLSMFSEAEQAQAIQAAGAVAYVGKSGPTETLLAAIRACVDRPVTP